jgi:hypothetical protein
MRLREIDPKLARQGAAAMVCVAATAAAMPMIASRGAEQREEAFWASKAAEFHTYMQVEVADAEPGALVHLASLATPGGYGAGGVGLLSEKALDSHAMTISANLQDSFTLAELEPMESGTISRIMKSFREQHCLAQAVYYEARSESYEGQLAVAEVVRNRVISRHWPNTYCGVVYEGSTRSTGCQFTFTCDGSIRDNPRGPAWRQAQSIAAQVYGGLSMPLTGAATHYHTTAVDPYWNDSLVQTRRIGAHIFYRLPSKREKRAIEVEASLRGRYDAGETGVSGAAS